MFVIDRVELERLADFGATLYVTCHRTQRNHESPSPAEHSIAGCADQFISRLIRDCVLRGDLVAAARIMIDPELRCCCGIRFLAQVEQYLEAEDVRALQALWEEPTVSDDEMLAALGVARKQ